MRPLLLLAGCLSQGLQPAPVLPIEVQGGTFLMGSTETCSDTMGALCGGDHGPHQVTVSSFSIADREVTRAQWALCEQSGMCATLPDLDYHAFRVDRPDDPVLVDSPTQAATFCTWMNGRLPTEAEFELVQRGGDVNHLHTFPWGDGKLTNDVTPSGIHDLAGGVAEWIFDGYNPDIGCPDRLTTDDVCTMSATCCGGDGGNCIAQCLPPAAGATGDQAGTLACSPGSVPPDVDPFFSGSSPMIRGRFTGERDCYLAGYTRRYAPGTYSAGFRCVLTSPTPAVPSTLRLRLDRCPSGATVNLQAQGNLTVDVFDGTTATSEPSSGMVTGLPCGSTFVLRDPPIGNILITNTTASCTTTWQYSNNSQQGDSSVLTLTPTTSGQCGTESCSGVNLMTDPKNCGTCGNVCADNVCTSGSCTCNGANTMTDATNCGACGHSCFGTSCVMGQCQPGLIADTQPSPFAVVADASGAALFFSNRVDSGGSVVACPVNLTTGAFDCAPLASNLAAPGYLALDSNNLYWADFGDGRVSGCPRGGCGLLPTLYDGAMNGTASGVTIESGSLLYTFTNDGAIWQCTLPSCNMAAGLIVSGEASGGFGPFGIAADTNNVYYTINGPGGSLRSCPRAGCGGNLPQVIVPALNNPGPLVLDSSVLYFYDSTTISGWTVAGLLGPLFVRSVPSLPGGIATDATHLYWTQPADGTIWSCQKSSCTSTARTIATGQSGPLGIAVAGPGLFWANSTGGQVVGMAIPLDGPTPP